MKLALLSLFITTFAFANSGTDLLIKDSSISVPAQMVQVQKQIKLDDPFLIQFYGVWKAARIYDEDFTKWAHILLEKNYEKALVESYQVKLNSKAKVEMVNAARLYTLWNLKLNQTFFNTWLELVSHRLFFNSQFAHTIDQLIANNASDWLVKNSIYISESQRADLKKIASLKSRFNYSAQAYFNLRSGVKGLELIGKLPVNDKLRLRLGDSVILGYARKNELANSAKLLKEIYEPVLKNETDVEKLSSYYLLLARLLYQAKAFEASEHYYNLIPDESSKFLTAQAEKLWITMRFEDLASIKGDVLSLEMNIFEDKFMPEVYTVAAMANLKLCQFKSVEKNFNDFIRVQSNFAKLIDKNLNSSAPEVIKRDFYVDRLIRHEQLAKAEKERLTKINQELFSRDISNLDQSILNATRLKTVEIKRKWKNRKKMIESSLRKMRFVKVEFLSLMRRLSNSLAKVKMSDQIKLTSSGIDKSNSVIFPYDGVRFSDELFNYKSNLKQLCLKGNK